jgi:hypothetical protein
MCSRGSSSESLKSQYSDAEYVLLQCPKYHPLVVLEELGLANVNPKKPLKFLHFVLDKQNNTDVKRRITTVGVSNYATDYANMNRALLTFTDLPSDEALGFAFAFAEKQEGGFLVEKLGTQGSMFTPQFEGAWRQFRDFRSRFSNDPDMSPKPFLKLLWPGNSRPGNLALRSIYDIYRQTHSGSPPDAMDFLCRFCRELTNARRLIEQPAALQTLVSQAEQILRLRDSEALEVCHGLGNLMLVLNRFTSASSVKSLCILTEDYAALEGYESLRTFGSIFGSRGDHLFRLLCRQPVEEALLELRSLLQNREPGPALYFFARDFHCPPSEISRNGVRDLIPLLKSESAPPLIVGNNPMTDSLLDVLNLSTDGNTRALLALDGFSLEVDVRPGFFVVFVVDRDDLTDPDDPFPLPLLDRVETIALNWDLIRFVFLLPMIVSDPPVMDLVIAKSLSSPGSLRSVLETLRERRPDLPPIAFAV